jgi:hypothetical protein
MGRSMFFCGNTLWPLVDCADSRRALVLGSGGQAWFGHFAVRAGCRDRDGQISARRAWVLSIEPAIIHSGTVGARESGRCTAREPNHLRHEDSRAAVFVNTCGAWCPMVATVPTDLGLTGRASVNRRLVYYLDRDGETTPPRAIEGTSSCRLRGVRR